MYIRCIFKNHKIIYVLYLLFNELRHFNAKCIEMQSTIRIILHDHKYLNEIESGVTEAVALCVKGRDDSD